MLLSLAIENFALIEKLSMNFSAGFNVLTGETGAGKSIIIGAINMVLGERASADLIKTGAERAFVEAVFSIKDNPPLFKLLDKLGIEKEETMVISRELSSGKSIARLNNRTIPQSVLREISAYLFDIHGQHQHQSLLQVEEHINILDSFGGKDLAQLRKKIAEEYAYLQKFLAELKDLRSSAENREKEKDYLEFQIKELDMARLQPGEWQELQQEEKRLKNAAKLKEKAQAAFSALDQMDGQLRSAQSALKEMVNLDAELLPQSQEIDTSLFSIKDILAFLRDYQKRLSANPDRLNEVSDRLAFLNSLKRKHFPVGKEPADELITLLLRKKEQLAQQYQKLLNYDQDTSALEKNIRQQQEHLGKDSMELSMKRLATAKTIEKKIMQNLDDLNMQNSVFKVQLSQVEDPENGVPVLSGRFKIFETGIDQVEFLISANPGEPPKPLAKIASGGEISRIMLALKSVLADADPIPTMVFDEIDTGIGGRTAKAVGNKLHQLALKRQVICVTHLPQIASLAQQHLVVEKEFAAGRTIVSVKLLRNDTERKAEISRMLSGTTSEITLKHAEEILKS